MSTSGVSSQDTAPRSDVCYLWNLPAEILHLTLDFAYGYRTERIIMKSKFDRDLKEKAKSGTLTGREPPFRHKVDDFLVSKQFFMIAAEAYIKEQRMKISYGWDDSKRTLFTLFASSAEVPEYSPVHTLRNFPRLKALTIKINTWHFDDHVAKKKYPWLQLFDNDDLSALDISKGLSEVRGLTTFVCKPVLCGYANTPEKELLWQRNIGALEAFLRPIVTARKPDVKPRLDSEYAALSPLYPGSRVTSIGGPSALLTEAGRFLSTRTPKAHAEHKDKKINNLHTKECFRTRDILLSMPEATPETAYAAHCSLNEDLLRRTTALDQSRALATVDGGLGIHEKLLEGVANPKDQEPASKDQTGSALPMAGHGVAAMMGVTGEQLALWIDRVVSEHPDLAPVKVARPSIDLMSDDE